MPVVSLPISKGEGRSRKNLDYTDNLPVNMLTVISQADEAPGFMRFFPGLKKSLDVGGASRGVDYNVVKGDCYRVMGRKLYLEGKEVGDVSGGSRVFMANSRTSQAVSNGDISLYAYDGKIKKIENWPDEVEKGFTKTIASQVHNIVGDSLKLTPETVTGDLTLTLYPATKSGKKNGNMVVEEDDWQTPQSQPKPELGTPYVKNLRVTGIKASGLTIYVEYDFYSNNEEVTNPVQSGTNTADQAKALKTLWGKADPELEEAIIALGNVQRYEDDPTLTNVSLINSMWAELDDATTGPEIIKLINDNRGPDNDLDASRLEWVQKVDDFTISGTSYDWGETGDICRLRGRYIFAQAGTDTIWVTSIEDESKIDRIAPAYRAEYMPDGIKAVRTWRDFVVCFGSSTVEFFRLTGVAENLLQSQPAYLIETGISGSFAVTEYMDSFAFVTSPAKGMVTISIMGQGSHTPISTRYINQILAKYDPSQLSEIILEKLSFDSHELLICHLPNETLVFDATSKLWSVIKTGLDAGTHRAIDYCKTGSNITCGDKLEGFIGDLTFDSCSQYGEQQEIELYTPLVNAPNTLAFDMEIVSGTGVSSNATRLLISSTEDGIIYGNETPLIINEPKLWLLRPILRNIGRIRNRIGFKLRVVTDTPATLSKLTMRVE